VPESGSLGSVRGAASNGRPYGEHRPMRVDGCAAVLKFRISATLRREPPSQHHVLARTRWQKASACTGAHQAPVDSGTSMFNRGLVVVGSSPVSPAGASGLEPLVPVSAAGPRKMRRVQTDSDQMAE
jgi:hypothetical protein